MNSKYLLFISLISIVIIFMVTSCRLKCSKNKNESYSKYQPRVEFREECTLAGVDHCELSNGREGVCDRRGMCTEEMYLYA